jgi:DNA excision repair protein ERCC-3
MRYDPNKPIIVQNDFTILLETRHDQFETIRTEISRFADLVKSPDHLHTYRMSSITLWNAAAAGMTADRIIAFLEEYAKFGLSSQIREGISKFVERYGMLRLESIGDELLLISEQVDVIKEMIRYTSLQSYGLTQTDERTLKFSSAYRGLLKQELIKLGYPVNDLAGYHTGETLPIHLREENAEGQPFQLRDYQQSAVEAFYKQGGGDGGSGVLVLPCGAGKTVIGIAAMGQLNCATLILTSNVTSVRQWKREIMEKTDVPEYLIGEYGGNKREVCPITIATYQILTYRKSKDDEFEHMELFRRRDWGLIVYDEVHLLPAPVFRATAEIQATRRLGLTATLVREDGRQEDVFSLVGPKRYDMPWKRLESAGYIASVECIELRVPLNDQDRSAYRAAEPRKQIRIAAENPGKLELVEQLLRKHEGEQTIIIGEMPQDNRDELYEQFRKGEIKTIVVSKVANFAVDLPDAAIAIQISGSFGSRQEEAQRIGRILRPKAGRNEAFFYSIITTDSKEEQFSLNRQLFLVEQGYRYRIEHAAEWLEKEEVPQ